MRIEWQHTPQGSVGFHAQPGEYDAVPPVDALLMESSPTLLNPERKAIAAYLAFGRWTSGDFTLDFKFGPTTASAIERDTKHLDIRPGPIEYYPKPLSAGTDEVAVEFDARVWNDPHTTTLSVLPSSEWAGGLRSLSSIAIATNAFALDHASLDDTISIRARLAVAVLFSEELAADTLIVSSGECIDEQERLRLTNLLLAARLGLLFQDPR